jgi:hypothetical protein
MQRGKVWVWASLALLCWSARANAQTPGVKESPMAKVRVQLTHYDLTPQGTIALLPVLASHARTAKGPEAAEASFLRAAAASDLLFLAEYTQNAALRASLASQFGVAPEALGQAIGAALSASARGVYREAAQAALSALQRTAAAGEPPSLPSDVRRDAAFLHDAVVLAIDPAPSARFAALTADPCAGQKTCAAPYADFDADGRRVLAYVQQLSAAALRLSQARSNGDPLAEAVASTVDREFAALRGMALRLTPRLTNDLRLQLPAGAGAWPSPDLLVLISARELRYAHLPRVRPGTDGKFELLAESDVTYPKMKSLAHAVNDNSPATRPIDAFVDAMRTARGDAANPQVALVADTDVSAQLLARALVSMRKAGLPQLLLVARTKDGSLLGVPSRVVLPTDAPAGATPDLRLRVRLGGYSLDVGHGMVDIPRVRDASGFHFDLVALQSAAKKRAPRSAAVSFMSEVATEQVLMAMFYVTPERAPIDVLIQ